MTSTLTFHCLSNFCNYTNIHKTGRETWNEKILKDYSTGNYSVTIWKQNENPSARAALIATKWSSLLRRPSRRKSTFRYHTSCCQSTISNFCKGQGHWVALSNWVVLGEKRIFFGQTSQAVNMWQMKIGIDSRKNWKSLESNGFKITFCFSEIVSKNFSIRETIEMTRS